MDKNAIKKYAVWARRELIERVSQRAMICGITAKDAGDPNTESVNGHLLSQAEKRQRQALIRNIKTKGYEQVMEEVAYTWFNRFAALRFMEVNGYLPSHIRVFTNDAGEFKPQILAEAIHLEMEGLDINKVYELESANKSEELFKYLLIVQCNALNSILPGMFQRIEDYTELLLPDYLLREGSVIEKMITDIPEEDWNTAKDGQIEILGWLYQYYISEKHEAVVNAIGKKTIEKEDVPAATALFTTDWVVRFIVDNSVGRYWIERNPSSKLKDELEYFVMPKGEDIETVDETISPDQLTVLDPSMGSAHFGIYAFEVLIKIYTEYGYTEREAAALIVKNNLFGLDIDDRSAQIAYFSIMMKARQYDRRFFTRGIQPNFYSIQESNGTDNYLISVFMYRNFGFCIKDGYSGFMTPNVWMFISSYEKLRNYLINFKSVSTCVQLAKGAFFKEATVDICAFVLKNGKGERGTYIRLEDFKGDMDVQRTKLLEAINGNDSYMYSRDMDSFQKIEDAPFAYWISERFAYVFETAKPLSMIAPPKQGLATADNNTYLRLWFEPVISKIGFGMHSCEEAEKSGLKWFPYNKGGAFRRWYGNRDYVVNWEEDGREIKNFKDENGKVRSRPQNLAFYFRPSITWSDLTSASFSGRYCEGGFIFDIKGSSGFPSAEYHLYVLGLLNSKISQECISVLNPTISTQVGDMARIPVFVDAVKKAEVETLVSECVKLSKEDWDAFETSWDFTKHPFIRDVNSLAAAFSEWKNECNTRFETVRLNEERINQLFTQIYGLEEELEPDVDPANITIRKADLQRDIRSFISYSVGCMFGRYSLDISGLAYAGGNWAANHYKTFLPDKDGIIPICDDEYFEDDIVGRFVKFVETVYGKATLEENLRFIAEALGGKGSARDVIRSYFINDFYADHCANYSVFGSGKRPIYWLFDSGKKNGFKCLIYMHRYQPDTIARIRTDYVHEQQSRYRTAIADLEQRINGAATSERVKLSKQLAKLQAQAEEIRVYEEKIHHLADQMIKIDLDDGVKHNYEIFKDVLAKIK